MISLNKPVAYRGSLHIRRTDGQLISNDDITKDDLNQLQLVLKSGLYLFDFISDQGDRIIKKVIIVQ